MIAEKLKIALVQGQWWWALIFSYAAGILSSLTACVYPLIPITVALFGARDKGIRRIQAVGLASSFVFGIAVMYMTLGLCVSLLGKQFGSFLSSPYLIIPVSLIFLLMAASLFGAFSLNLPSGFHVALTKIGGKGPFGAFLMGLVAGIIASPCTGPVLVSLLAVAASQGSLLIGALLLFSYALGLGTLFFFVGVFALQLPKSGPWMERIKSILAIVMILGAVFFLRNISTVVRNYGERTWLFLLGHLVLVVMGVFLGGVHLKFQKDGWILLRKSMGVLLICVGGFGILSWLLTPPKLLWSHDENVLNTAQSQRRPVLIDFSATWCLPCVEMETKTFADPQVKEELSRFLLWKVDCSEGCSTIGHRFGINTLPGLILIDSDGRTVKRVEEFIPPEKLLPLLQQIK